MQYNMFSESYTPSRGRRFKVGDKVRIVDNSNCHEFRTGEIVTIREVCDDGSSSDYAGETDNEYWYLVDKDIEPFEIKTSKKRNVCNSNYYVGISCTNPDCPCQTPAVTFTTGGTVDYSDIYEGPSANPKILETTRSLHDLLQYKNKRYGNSSLEPINVFSKTDSATGLLQRIDDKIARIQNSPELRKNDVSDLVGYLILLCVSKGWNNFDEFKD
jgi:hypothetical protein